MTERIERLEQIADRGWANDVGDEATYVLSALPDLVAAVRAAHLLHPRNLCMKKQERVVGGAPGLYCNGPCGICPQCLLHVFLDRFYGHG